jgi:ElaB/YqjD/DUF883 family membrane-anchored ribosome-binding protein
MAMNNPQGMPFNESRRLDSGSVLDTVKEKAQDFASGASDLAGQVKDRASDLASNIGHQASQAWDSTRHGVEHAASAVSDQAGEAFDNVTGMIRRYPIPSLLIAFGVGFLVAQVIQVTTES